MAIGDITRRVVTKFEADTSDLSRGLDKLKEKTEQTSKGALGWAKTFGEGLKSVNEGINLGVKKLGELGLAFEGARKIIDFAKDSLREWGKDLRLEATTAGINIDRLSESLHGLVEEDTLREFAAKAANGALKLSQQQLEQMSEAALALTSRGYDLTESLHKLEDAAVTGRMRGLHELGIEVEEGASKFETMRNMTAELGRVIREVGPHIDNQADKVDQLAAKWADAWKNVKNYSAAAMGSLMESDAWSLGAKFGAAVLGGDLTGGVAGAIPGLDGGLVSRLLQESHEKFNALKLQNYRAGTADRALAALRESQLIEMPDLNVGRSEAERRKMAEEAARNAARSTLRGAIRSGGNLQSVGGRDREMANFFTDYSLGTAADTTMYNEYGVPQGEQQLLEQVTGQQNTRDWMSRIGEINRRQGVLTSMFGSVDEINGFAVAFNSLGTAVNSAMSAWISGSMTAGQAIKKGIGDALGGVASQMAIESLKHGAFAIGNLAFGNAAGAATHAAAAAAFGAGAIAAAAAARQLGGNVGAQAKVGGGGAGAYAGGSYGGSSQGASGSRTIVYVGGAWSNDSARMQQLQIEKAVGEAFKNSLGANR